MKSIHDFKSVDQYKEYLRTYFAAMAMQGYIASSSSSQPINAASFAIKCSDELLKQLEDGKS